MSKIFKLSEYEVDQLKEIINIGVSHAGTTLSQMVNRRITISVPEVEIKSAETVSQFVDNPDDITLAVLLGLSGGIEGYIFLFFPQSAARQLLHALSGKSVGDLRALDKYDRSIFQEIGNIITGGMLGGLSRFLHLEMLHSVPNVVVDMGGAMFNSLAATMVAHHEEFISLDVSVCVNASEDAILCNDGEEAVGRMFLFIGPDAVRQVLAITKEIKQAEPS